MVSPTPEAVKLKADERSAVRAAFARRVFASEYWVLYLSAAYFLALLPFVNGFGSAGNVGNIFSNILPLVVVVVGQTFVLIVGGIDLSVTSTIAFASIVGASVMSADGGFLGGSAWAVPAGVAAMLLAGALIGLANGAIITRFGMPPFIVTLTGMMFFSGAAVWLTQSRNIYNLPAAFLALGKGSFLFVPYALLIAAAVVAAAHVVLAKSLLGRWLYATGINERAAAVSGVPVRAAVVAAYTASGLCAALASVLYTSRLETGSPVLGQRILLDVIGSAVIGGISLFGGKGRVAWAVFGVLFMTLIDNSLNLLGLSYFAIMIVKGAVILFAALVDAFRHKLFRGV